MANSPYILEWAVTGQLEDMPTHGLPTRGLNISWTRQLAH